MLFEEFDEFTRKLCLETEKMILPLFDSPDLVIEEKEDHTPVTIADRETEREIREAIEVVYPDHGIIGEEMGETQPDAEFKWVIDPIDGTKSFAAGCPLFGTMIALLQNGQPIYGCVNYPAIGKRLSGDGKRAFANGEPIHSRQGIRLEDALLLTTDLLSVGDHRDGERFDALARSAGLCRTWGDCFGYYLLAIGKADIMIDPILSPWDFLALIPILRGAGVAVTDWNGNDPASGNSIVAANADLHATVLAALNGGKL